MSTKTDSLVATRSTLSASQARIMDALFMRSLSRAQLADATGMRLSSVCGRVNELLAKERLAIKGTAWDDETRRNVELVGIA